MNLWIELCFASQSRMTQPSPARIFQFPSLREFLQHFYFFENNHFLLDKSDYSLYTWELSTRSASIAGANTLIH